MFAEIKLTLTVPNEAEELEKLETQTSKTEYVLFKGKSDLLFTRRSYKPGMFFKKDVQQILKK